MKSAVFLTIFLMAGIKVFGQYDFPRYDFLYNTKGVDSIIAESTSNNSVWKEVFNYKNNRIVKESNFEKNGDLFYYRIFAYDDKKKVKYETYFGKTNGFDSAKNDFTDFWDLSYYDLVIESFSHGKVVQEMKCNVNGTDTTINQVTTYTYDSNQKLSKVQTQDVFVGLVGSFKSNSVELSRVGEKNDVITYTKLFEYLTKKIVVLYKVNDILKGKEIIELNDRQQPNFRKQYDAKNNLISETSAKYDEKNRLKSLTWKSYSAMTIWGGEGDVASDGTETIAYDNQGRPIQTVTVYNSNNKHTTTYKYY